MSLFDQPYYALTKSHMSRIGIWPEQSKYVRIILPLTMFAITLTMIGPMLIRLHDAWRDINILANTTTFLLIAIGIFLIVSAFIHHIDNMLLLLKKIEQHWEIIKNTPAVIVLDKYAEQGRYITVIYSRCTFVGMIFYFGLCLSPVILDFVDPVNETRSKIYIVEAEYGVDADKYYWFIMAHTYIIATITIYMMVAIGTMYILWVVHACALFEVVGLNFDLISNEDMANEDNAITLHIDWHYKKMSDCIILHTEAISFADTIETVCSGSDGVVLGIIAFITAISGVQVLINWKNPEVLIQQIMMIIGQVFHLYMISILGQELMNRSEKIHRIAYNLSWQNMSLNAQKLLIPILMRSAHPCYFTAGKLYVLSLETFGSALRAVISYFTIFAQMI